MATSTLLRLQQLQYDNPRQFITVIVDTVYPALFDEVNKLITQVVRFRNNVIKRMSDDIEAGLRSMFIEETQTLFPLIEQLPSNQPALACEHFKATKLFQKNLLNTCSELRFVLDEQSQRREAANQLKSFETLLVLFQTTKNKYLFAKFKNCKNCQLAGEVTG